MGTIERIYDIIRAYANYTEEEVEANPQSIELLLSDIRQQVQNANDATVRVKADEIMVRRQLEECDAELDKIDAQAREALKTDDEGKARDLLTKKLSLQDKRAGLAKSYAEAQARTAEMRAKYEKISADAWQVEEYAKQVRERNEEANRKLGGW